MLRKMLRVILQRMDRLSIIAIRTRLHLYVYIFIFLDMFFALIIIIVFISSMKLQLVHWLSPEVSFFKIGQNLSTVLLFFETLVSLFVSHVVNEPQSLQVMLIE